MEEKRIPYSFVNEEDVLKRLGGNIALFNRLFNKFIVMYRFVDSDIQKLLENKNYADARMLAHTIKGTSANLGITPLWHNAALLEKDIAAQDDEKIEKSMETFRQKLTEIIEETSNS